MTTEPEATGCLREPIQPNCGRFEPTMIRDEFSGNDRRCFFYEDCGRDVSFDRWRVYFYYASHLALTKFFPSAEAKDAFISSLNPAS